MQLLVEGKCLWDFSLSGEPIVLTDDHFLPPEACRGKIIFTHIPSPEIVLYLREALALVAETGGVLCHAAVLALEIGCPIIVAAEDASAAVEGKRRVTLCAKDGIGGIYA